MLRLEWINRRRRQLEVKRSDDDGKSNGRETECIISSRMWGETCEEKNEPRGAKGEGALTRKDKERGNEL